MVSQTLTDVINTVAILQYVNIVLTVKQRYQYIRHMLSEATFTHNVSTSRHMYTGHPVSHGSKKLFFSARCDVAIDVDSRKVCRIHDLQIIYSELYDVLQANSKSYGIIILLNIMTILTNAVPAIYLGAMFVKVATFNNGRSETYLRGIALFSMCAFQLLTFLWMTICCQSTAEEVQDTYVCIQKLLLYPNRLIWITADLKRLSSQLKNLKLSSVFVDFSL
jgi:hypothetical protein